MESLPNGTVGGPTNGRPTVASITVAWNGSDVIGRHLSALLCQSVPLAEVIVVDNASDDGTVHILQRDFPKATMLPISENTGVGGGFAAGLQYAVTKQYDWFWLFDQDSVPAPTALEALFCGLRTLSACAADVGVLACAPVDPENGFMNAAVLWRSRFLHVSPQQAQGEVCFVDSVISSGSLIRRDVVNKIGFPRKDFFMDFVDNEYNLRVRKAGYRIALVRKSVMYHRVGETRAVRRLRYWGRVRLRPFEPTWRQYYMSRNETYLVWHLMGTTRSRLFHSVRILRQAASIVWYDREKIAKLRMHFKGTLDGLAKRLGKKELSRNV